MSLYQCPECEGVQMRVTYSGRDALGQPIRQRRCVDCDDSRITTVEVQVEGWTAAQLSDNQRIAARLRERKRRGYQENVTRPPYSRWISSSIKVISEGQESRGPAARALREQGLTYQEIADRLGISKHTVYEHCHGRAKPWREGEGAA